MVIARKIFFVLLLTLAATTFGGSPDSEQYVGFEYNVVSNITYRETGSWAGKLDLYVPWEIKPDAPLLVWIHGGGWTRGSKEEEALFILPYLEEGWAIANVEYRVAATALAPAAVDDCQCALAWLAKNANKYKYNTRNVIIGGASAGGHLALTSAGYSKLITEDCKPPSSVHISTVINWFGPSDITNLAFGEKPFDRTVTWLGNQSNAKEIANDVSPIHFVHTGMPPVITIHGTKDELIPYTQSVEFHQALTVAKVPNELVTLKDANHGIFSRPEISTAYQHIFQFLEKYAAFSKK